MDAKESLERLKCGNQTYLQSLNQIGDISAKIRLYTAEHGQHPFAVIIACSDSREIPEAIFSCGIGELFVIRIAGNIVDDSILGSIEYAVSHLGCQLVVVLGHTNCGAVSAAISGHADRYIKKITDKISAAIKTETDTTKASCLNINNTVATIRDVLLEQDNIPNVRIMGALYDVRSGEVTFYEE
ncbi:MAG: carbonic anhydrase [Lachnospiraceae bacterium]|nr:carbonic anhydrase [Lachnospiraceae bacterium]